MLPACTAAAAMVTRSACDVTIYVTRRSTRFRSADPDSCRLGIELPPPQSPPHPHPSTVQLSYLAGGRRASLKLTRLFEAGCVSSGYSWRAKQ